MYRKVHRRAILSTCVHGWVIRGKCIRCFLYSVCGLWCVCGFCICGKAREIISHRNIFLFQRWLYWNSWWCFGDCAVCSLCTGGRHESLTLRQKSWFFTELMVEISGESESPISARHRHRAQLPPSGPMQYCTATDRRETRPEHHGCGFFS